MRLLVILFLLFCMIPVVFLRCHSSCNECVYEDDPTACISCASTDDYLYLHGKGLTGMCKSTCKSGRVLVNPRRCVLDEVCPPGGCQCHQSCIECLGPGEKNCTKCPEGRLLLKENSGDNHGKCILIEGCRPPSLISITSRACYNGSCTTNDCVDCTDKFCLECTQDKLTCTKCIDPNMYIEDGKCVEECPARKIRATRACYNTAGKCPEGYTEIKDECLPCHTSCGKDGCEQPNDASSCLGCKDGFYLKKASTGTTGMCILSAECHTPYFRNDPSFKCYTDKCPEGETCYQCHESCDGCVEDNSAENCTACASSKMLLLTPKDSLTNGQCIPEIDCKAKCCRNDVEHKAYSSNVSISDGETCTTSNYYLCHADCNGCTGTNKADACIACRDPTKYLKLVAGTQAGECMDASQCPYIAGDTKACLTSKPENLWCNETSHECFSCDPECTTCAASKDPKKCTGCSEPESYVLAWAKYGYGQCINKKACVIPKYRDDTNRMCYIDACPEGATCLQCSVVCDGCYKSDSVTSCVKCALKSEIMLSDTGECIKSSECVSPMYRDDINDICYEHRCPTTSGHCKKCADECVGCTKESSFENCLGCKDPNSYLLRYSDSVDGVCVDLVQCPPYKDEINKIYSCPIGSSTCFFCHSTCTTCSESSDPNKCKGCFDPNLYLNKSSIVANVGNCVSRSEITQTPGAYLDDINKMAYWDNKCPPGLYRDTNTSRCLLCASECGVRGCTESENADKCQDCSDPDKYLYLESNDTVGKCIPIASCKPPALKDISAKICYNTTTCPNRLYLEPLNYTCYRHCPTVFITDTVAMRCRLAGSGAVWVKCGLTVFATIFLLIFM